MHSINDRLQLQVLSVQSPLFQIPGDAPEGSNQTSGYDALNIKQTLKAGNNGHRGLHIWPGATQQMVLNPDRLKTRTRRAADVRAPIIADAYGLGTIDAKIFKARKKDAIVWLWRQTAFTGYYYCLKTICKMWNFKQAVFLRAPLRLRVGNDRQLVAAGKALQYARRFGKDGSPGFDRLPIIILPLFKNRQITLPAVVPIDLFPESFS